MPKQGTKMTTGYVSWEEFKRLQAKLLHDNDTDVLLLISVGVYTALRISDVLRLKWADFGGDQIEIKEKKTGKTRLISINKDLKEIVEKIKSSQEIKDENELFINKSTSRPYTRMGVNKMLKRIFKKYKVVCDGNVSSHLFRKTFGRRVMENNGYSGEALLLLMDTFQHSSPALTKRYLGIRQQEINTLYETL